MISDLVERLRLGNTTHVYARSWMYDAADRIEELEAVLQEVDAWVEDLGYYADDGAVLVPVFKKVKSVLGKGYT
jgi:hypothetical protein